jgi:3-keto-5-aminohexanoate cleavage enzyme
METLKNYLIHEYRETPDYVAKLSRGGLSEFPPLIISCAITGANQGKEANINLPESAEEQAEQTYGAYKAGASIVHVHRRSSKNHAIMTQDPDEYKEVNALIREKCPDIIINNTAACGRVRQVTTPVSPEAGGKVSPLMLTSIYAGPDISSLEISNFAGRFKRKKRMPPLSGRDEDIIEEHAYGITPSEVEYAISLMKQYDVKPEYEIYDLGDILYLNQLIDLKLVQPPYFVQMVFGAINFPTASYLLETIRCLPRDSILSCIGIGAVQYPLITMAMILGCHVRVGMEDNIYIERGKLAESNAQLVEKAVRIAKELGRPIATPAQAREMLGLPGPRDFKYKK